MSEALEVLTVRTLTTEEHNQPETAARIVDIAWRALARESIEDPSSGEFLAPNVTTIAEKMPGVHTPDYFPDIAIFGEQADTNNPLAAQGFAWVRHPLTRDGDLATDLVEVDARVISQARDPYMREEQRLAAACIVAAPLLAEHRNQQRPHAVFVRHATPSQQHMLEQAGNRPQSYDAFEFHGGMVPKAVYALGDNALSALRAQQGLDSLRVYM